MRRKTCFRGLAVEVFVWRYLSTRRIEDPDEKCGGRRRLVWNGPVGTTSRDVAAAAEARPWLFRPGRYRLEHRDQSGTIVRVESFELAPSGAVGPLSTAPARRRRVPAPRPLPHAGRVLRVAGSHA